MANSDVGVIAWAAEQVREFRRVVPGYAGLRPVRTDEVGKLLARYRCDLQVFDFVGEAQPVAMALPPILDTYIIALNAGARRVDRQLAVLHETSHVAAREAGAFMRDDEGYMADHERRADLVAIAGMFPGHLVQLMRRAGGTWRAAGVIIQQHIRNEWALDWPRERVKDRVKLRVRLYRECGI